MRAISGYIEDGRFTPLEVITLPKRAKAILIINENANPDRNERLSWLNDFHSAIKSSADEEMPSFPRVRLERELIDLSDEV